MYKALIIDDEKPVQIAIYKLGNWGKYHIQPPDVASNGKEALSAMRELHPDLCFVDMHMPIMNGMEYLQQASAEFPTTQFIIISGYDDFEYARQAIRVGVEQYLLKPITKMNLQKALEEIREKIENERAQEDYLEKFKEEMLEYEQFSRRNFFEKVFEGQLSVQEIYEEAQKLSLEMNASGYNLAMVSLWEKKNVEERSQDSRLIAGKREELTRYFRRYPEFLMFRWNINTYGILMKGEAEQMQELKAKCLENIVRICSSQDGEIEWYLVMGEPVERLSLLPECYNKVNRLMSYRFLKPQEHILTSEVLTEFTSKNDEKNSLGGVDISKVDPEILKGFLMRGQAEEVEDFVDSFLESQKMALKSKLFRDYMMLSIRFTAIAFVEKLGYSQDEFLESSWTDKMQNMSLSEEDMRPYMLSLLRRAIELSTKEKDSQGKKLIKKALEYIEENYARESLSLNEAAGAVEVSANYFSAVFSQEMEMTFTEYVTQKRMEKAKMLLRQTEMHSGEIAAEIGFKDPHYFSFVFKKTQGCTPREYRSGGARS